MQCNSNKGQSILDVGRSSESAFDCKCVWSTPSYALGSGLYQIFYYIFIISNKIKISEICFLRYSKIAFSYAGYNHSARE